MCRASTVAGFTLGSGEARVNPVHGADLAEFIVERLAGPAGSRDVGGSDVFTYRELVELAFRVAGRRLRVLRLGLGVTRPLLWVADRLLHLLRPSVPPYGRDAEGDGGDT